MCFTQEVSAGFAIFMWVWSIVWKGPTGARITVAYFALMETIQAAQYSVLADGIDSPLCASTLNKGLTVAGMVHLCFQPFFSNLFLMQVGPVGGTTDRVCRVGARLEPRGTRTRGPRS